MSLLPMGSLVGAPYGNGKSGMSLYISKEGLESEMNFLPKT
jgi:hypothetical protein